MSSSSSSVTPLHGRIFGGNVHNKSTTENRTRTDDRIRGVNDTELHKVSFAFQERQETDYELSARRAEQTESALRQSDGRFPKLLEEIYDGFVLVNQSGNIIEWNTANERITGLKRKEVLGCPVWEILFRLVFPDHRNAELRDHQQQIIQDALRTGQSPVFGQPYEVPFIRKDGTKGTMIQSAFPIEAQSGCLIGIVMHDISELRLTEEMMRHAQRMESLGLMAGGIAHDFNNLLQAVLGQTSLALKALPARHPVRESIAKATNAAEHAASLTRQLLAYAGRGKSDIRPINVNSFLQDNLFMLEASIAKHIKINTLFAEHLPPIDADPGQLQQVAMNLIINASEALGPDPGVITVKTSQQEIDITDNQWMHHTEEPLATGTYVVMEIGDTGCGMTTETFDRIFDPFFTTKLAGRGLGLAAVLGIVKGHKGGLIVESTRGAGTTFRVAFPACAHVVVPTKPSEPVIEDFPIKGTVLVIDDEEFVREAAANILDLSGLLVVTAANGEMGITVYRERAYEIDVVLLDLSMPGIGGNETFKRLKQINPDVNVILTSGYPESEATAKFTGQCPAAFIQKPYRAEALIAAVLRFLPTNKSKTEQSVQVADCKG